MTALAKWFQNVIKDTFIGAQPFEHVPHTELKVKEGAIPIYNSSIRLTPIHLINSSKGYMKKLLEEDIIGEQLKPTEWGSPGFFISKKGSDKCRFVIDYQALNRCLERPTWPFVSSELCRKQLPKIAGYLIAMDL